MSSEPLDRVSAKPAADRHLEFAAASLLALATVASAWCAYQSARWNGVQTLRMSASDAAAREAAEFNLRAYNMRLLDTAMFMQFATAIHNGDQALQQFYLMRFRPEMRLAVEAWLATRPMTDPNAPPYPFVMPEYRLALADQAVEARRISASRYQLALEAKAHSDQYMLVTVLLASVLFFGGLATHFVSSRAKIGVFALGIITFLFVLLWLLSRRFTL